MLKKLSLILSVAAMTVAATVTEAQRTRQPARPALPLRLGIYVSSDEPCNTDFRNARLWLRADGAGRYNFAPFGRITPLGGNRFRVIERVPNMGATAAIWHVTSQTSFSWRWEDDTNIIDYRWCAAA